MANKTFKCKCGVKLEFVPFGKGINPSGWSGCPQCGESIQLPNAYSKVHEVGNIVVACKACSGGMKVERNTDKTRLICSHCGRAHAVTGLHVTGFPIIQLIAK